MDITIKRNKYDIGQLSVIKCCWNKVQGRERPELDWKSRRDQMLEVLHFDKCCSVCSGK